MVLTYWKTQVMTFEDKGETMTIVGDHTLVRSKVSLKAMRRMLRKGNGGYWVECTQMEVNPLEKKREAGG